MEAERRLMSVKVMVTIPVSALPPLAIIRKKTVEAGDEEFVNM